MSTGTFAALQAATTSCLAHRAALIYAQQAVVNCLETNGISQQAAVADAANPNGHGTLLDNCWQDPTQSIGAAPSAPTPAQQAVATCLVNNGISQQAALSDSTTPGANGDLLSACSGNPSYQFHPGFCQIIKGEKSCAFYQGTMAQQDAQAKAAGTNCPAALQGTVTGSRIALTIGLGAPGGPRAESAVVDTGSPVSYVLASQLVGTDFQPTGALATVVFGFIHNDGVQAQIYRGPMYVDDNGQWVSIGTLDVQALTKYPGVPDALGLGAFNVAHLTEAGNGWTMTFSC